LINNYTFWREVEMADEEMLLSLCASSFVAVITGKLAIDKEEKSWRQQTAWQTIT